MTTPLYGGRRIVIVVGLAATLLAIGGWFAWRATRPASPAVSGQPTILSLLVNADTRAEVMPGTPLMFEISLTGRANDNPITIGGASQPWPSLVHLARVGSDDALPWAAVQIGQPWATRLEREKRAAKVRTERGDTAVLERGRTSSFLLAVAPEATGNTAPGTYEIQAVLERRDWRPWGWRGRLESDPVSVVVSAGKNEKLERERLALSARYYLSTKRPKEALQTAADLVARDPRSVTASMLLGDALAALGRPRDALSAYRVALANSPRTYEAPVLLYERIANVSRQLAR